MLPAAARMRRRADFEEVRQHGRTVGRRLLSGRLQLRPDNDEPARVGFTVSRAVGPAVIRNRVRRRLRHLVRGYLPSLPDGSLLVCVPTRGPRPHARRILPLSSTWYSSHCSGGKVRRCPGEHNSTR